MTDPQIVYTYQGGATPPCHAYGPLEPAAAAALKTSLEDATPGLTVMVVPLEPAPASPS